MSSPPHSRTTRSVRLRALCLLLVACALPPANHAQSPTASVRGPDYTADGRIVPPTDYREWVYLGSGVDMSYVEAVAASAHPLFDNVFVHPEAYRVFTRTGRWPEKTQLVAEVRRSSQAGSINRRGHFQGEEIVELELHVKDSARFEGGWAFFLLDGREPARKLPTSEDCYACHQAHAAVDTTFVQFYPTLLPIAREHATFSEAYLKAEAGRARSTR